MSETGSFEDLAGSRWPSGVAIARAYAAQRDHFLRLYERAVRSEASLAPEPDPENPEPEPPPPLSPDGMHGQPFSRRAWYPSRRTRL